MEPGIGVLRKQSLKSLNRVRQRRPPSLPRPSWTKKRQRRSPPFQHVYPGQRAVGPPQTETQRRGVSIGGTCGRVPFPRYQD